MKKITESYITEANAKNVHWPRKGSTLWLLKDGESKIVKVTVTDVKKTPMEKGSKNNSYYLHIYLSENEYNIEYYMEHHFGSITYDDKHEQVSLHTHGFDDKICAVYIGTSKEAIQEFINTDGQRKLRYLLNEIEKKESELEDLMKKKQKAEADANLEITESLK